MLAQLAVFVHKHLTWNSLPAIYPDHPILTCDTESLAVCDSTAMPEVKFVSQHS